MGRKRFAKIDKHMTTVKKLVLKLCKETKGWRKGDEPPKKDRIDIAELEKLMEKGIDFDKKVGAKGKVGGDDDDDEEEETLDPNDRRDKERLKEKLSRTSIAVKKGSKGKKGTKKGKKGSKETKGWRKGDEPPKKDRIDIA